MVNSNSKNGIDYLKKMEWINSELEIPTKILNPQINFFNSEIFLPRQSYLEYKLLGVGILSTGRCSEMTKWN